MLVASSADLRTWRRTKMLLVAEKWMKTSCGDSFVTWVTIAEMLKLAPVSTFMTPGSSEGVTPMSPKTIMV
jgi:hypothetical protein